MVSPPAKSSRSARKPGIALCAFLAASLNLCAAGVALVADEAATVEPPSGPIAVLNTGWSPWSLDGDQCDGHLCGIPAAKRSGRSNCTLARVTAADLAVEILGTREAVRSARGDRTVALIAATPAPLRL